MGDDYIRTAKSGKRSSQMESDQVKHALKNALGTGCYSCVGTSIPCRRRSCTEQVSTLPGIGLLMVTAINGRDYPVMGITVMTVVAVLLRIFSLMRTRNSDLRISYK